MYEKTIMEQSKSILSYARLIGGYIETGDRTTFTGETIKASERVCILMERMFSQSLLREEAKRMQNRYYITEHAAFNPYTLLGGDI